MCCVLPSQSSHLLSSTNTSPHPHTHPHIHAFFEGSGGRGGRNYWRGTLLRTHEFGPLLERSEACGTRHDNRTDAAAGGDVVVLVVGAGVGAGAGGGIVGIRR